MFISIFLIVLLVTYYRLSIKYESKYKNGYIKEECIIINISDNNIIVKSREKLLVRVKNSDYSLGDRVLVKGKTIDIDDDYKKYLSNKNIYNVIDSYSIKIIKRNRNIFYSIKNIILKRINTNRYLSTFIMGDKSLIDNSIKRSYQSNGISHLFAISGMHIALLSTIFEKILRKIFDEENSFKITCSLLIIYLLLVGLYPSILRGVLFYILFKINNIYYFYIRKENIFLFILSLSLLINPKYIYDIAFWYSYLISFSLIRSSEYLKGNYIISLLKVSILSFIVSLPITIYSYYEINLFSIIYNLFYVPLVSFIIFPLTLIVFIFRFLEPIYNILIVILENSSLLLSKITIGKLVFRKVFVGIYVLYIVLVLLYLIVRKRVFIIIYFIILIIHLLLPVFEKSNYIEFFDVGQGDSILIHLNNKNIMIDTGGERELFYSKLNKYLKSKGTRKIDYLILSHGDFDHMGDSLELVNNYKVDNIIFNCGDYNDLELELIDLLKKKNINYYSCIDEVNINNNSLYFLNSNIYDNENDNSNVVYLVVNNYKFLFMGDASIEREKDILEIYDINNIDVLKVGHHGSNTSSSKYFINSINPKYSIISVGYNRYGHPNKEVLDNLEKTIIYRTDFDGSIRFKIKNKKIKIEIFSP